MRLAPSMVRIPRLVVPNLVRAVALDMVAAAVGAGIVALPMLMLGLPG